MVALFSSSLSEGQSHKLHIWLVLFVSGLMLFNFSPFLSFLNSNKALLALLDFSEFVSPFLARYLLRSHNLFLLEQAL